MPERKWDRLPQTPEELEQFLDDGQPEWFVPKRLDMDREPRTDSPVPERFRTP